MKKERFIETDVASFGKVIEGNWYKTEIRVFTWAETIDEGKKWGAMVIEWKRNIYFRLFDGNYYMVPTTW